MIGEKVNIGIFLEPLENGWYGKLVSDNVLLFVDPKLITYDDRFHDEIIEFPAHAKMGILQTKLKVGYDVKTITALLITPAETSVVCYLSPPKIPVKHYERFYVGHVRKLNTTTGKKRELKEGEYIIVRHYSNIFDQIEETVFVQKEQDEIVTVTWRHENEDVHERLKVMC